ncbi:MAG: O-antigen ligase family protein, partial [Kiritimatiellae bacterium]|nr:O-antigen ligase family protein [Kiritimatiellia bacterium]
GAGLAVGALTGGARPVPLRARLFFLSCVPFLAWAAVRAFRPSAPGFPLVAVEAERSVLLFLLPVLLALTFAVSSGPRFRRVFPRLFLADAVAVCACALWYHFTTDDLRILWMPGMPYTGRASAPFWCPNHFVDYAFWGGFVALSAALAPRVGFLRRAGLLLVFAFCSAAAFFSLSRGGIVSAAAGCLLVLPFLGLSGRRPWLRAVFALTVFCGVAGAALAVRYTDNPVMRRVEKEGLWKVWKDAKTPSDLLEDAPRLLARNFNRGQYISAALRAWRSNPDEGIGPGQHTHRWAQFEPTDEGVRPTGPDGAGLVRPQFADYGKHLYEVHSDWVQLLEEYGTRGLLLFLPPFLLLLAALVVRHCRTFAAGGPLLERTSPLAALLCLVSLAVHSTVDFTLLIPCAGWTLAAICSVAMLAEPEPEARKQGDAA